MKLTPCKIQGLIKHQIKDQIWATPHNKIKHKLWEYFRNKLYVNSDIVIWDDPWLGIYLEMNGQINHKIYLKI